jgi:hypothetical protein
MKMKWIIGVLKHAYVQKVIGEGVAYEHTENKTYFTN